jgi:predicted pyridoxine 5'-phosphate oxidase superfamily flavin-nucleotide-binding protein
MGTVRATITTGIQRFIDAQHVFFVATAPLAADGHVNLSPKGYGTLRVVDERTVAYLDLTGSGVETIAHVRENGRITLMWCAFDGPPRIVRVTGTAEVRAVDDERCVGWFDAMAGQRAIVVVDVDRVADSCGYSVPLMDYVGERTKLVDWAEHRSPAALEAYRAEKNATSIDGLPGLPGLSVP